jgi:hypothetical protein
MVMVLNQRNQPLMPCSCRKARILLRHGKAVVAKKSPFAIRLTVATGETIQPVAVGLDSGYLNVGVSAVAGGKELHAEKMVLRSDIVELNSERRQYRRNRRNRKTWYRQPRFLNRKKPEGWLAPSLQHKLDSQVKLVVGLAKVVPVSKVVVEVASFDIQKIKNPEIEGVGYQQGEQAGFANVREYVLYRDGHKCRHCKGKSKNKRLEVHHRESRKIGGNRPENLVTLCEACHNRATAGEDLGFGKTPLGFKAETFMTTVRWKLVDRLRELGFETTHTYGYITKMRRKEAAIEKTHANDAFVIAGGTGKHERQRVILLKKQVRKCNRKLFKGDRSHLKNTAHRLVKGFARFDKVRYKGIKCFVFGRRSTGYFDLRKLDGARVHASAKWTDLKLLERGGTMPSGYEQIRKGAAHSSLGTSPGVSCAML